ncbi:MAG: DNA mismatch repair endonuclease MutL [Clostridiales bacterium]|nr:DNA mismatch repair endonuclease MutL [Clostridiales bacterium]
MQTENKSKIRILDAATANQIAAGEVVERPASVVKELVENAIDAGATVIDVKIAGAGQSLIQVADNGNGMSAEDLRQCLKPHATSKLRKIEDLQLLSTLGFRGEALAAIASVSKITIISKTRANPSGYKISALGGQAAPPEESAAKDGTLVKVEELFYNTPARRKFLKSANWELGQISDYLGRLAISHPHIAFSLQNEERPLLRTTGGGDLNRAVAAVYGKDLLNSLVSLEWVQSLLIHGLVSLPEHTRPNRHHYNFFVNGRWVRCPELSQCVDEAYRTLIPAGRYPAVFLFLQMAPVMFDVNVHPSKLEIKLKDAETVQNNLKAAISGALGRKEAAAPRLGGLRFREEDDGFFLEEKGRKGKGPALRDDMQLREAPAVGSETWRSALYGSRQEAFAEAKSRGGAPENAEPQPLTQKSIFRASAPEAGNRGEAAPESPRELCFSTLSLIGQLSGSFILASAEDGLYIIDQHAAHERILYEKFRQKAAQKNETSALLSLPLTLELTHQESLWLCDGIVHLSALGFIVENFGDNTFILRGVPAWYDGSAPEELLMSVVAAYGEGVKKERVLLQEEDLFLMACKGAVKANQRLSESDIMSIFAGLDACQNASSCPHGRPVALKLSFAEIQRRFMRSGI